MSKEFTEILKMQAEQTLDFKLIIDKNEFDIIDITIKKYDKIEIKKFELLGLTLKRMQGKQFIH